MSIWSIWRKPEWYRVRESWGYRMVHNTSGYEFRDPDWWTQPRRYRRW